MAPKRRRRRQKRRNTYGISGSAVVPGSERSYIPLGSPGSLYDVKGRTATTRRKAIGGIGQLRPAIYEVGQIQQERPAPKIDPIELKLERRRRPRRGRWMQNPKVMRNVLTSLKAKGAVGQNDLPVAGFSRKGLSRRERALYNKMRIMGRVRSGIDEAMSIVE